MSACFAMFLDCLHDVCAFMMIWIKACKEPHGEVVRAKCTLEHMAMPIGKVIVGQVFLLSFTVDVLGVNPCGASRMAQRFNVLIWVQMRWVALLVKHPTMAIYVFRIVLNHTERADWD